MPEKARRVAIILPSLGLRDGEILRGIRAFVGPARNWWLHVIGDQHSRIRALRPWKPDGIIGVMRTRAVAASVAALRKPAVNVSNAMPPSKSEFARVASDDVTVGSLAAEYFLSLGFRSFAMFDEPGYWWSQCRKKGYEATIKGAGFNCRFYEHPTKPRRRQNPMAALDHPESILKWARTLLRPTALFVVNDYRARELLELFHAAGISVPSDLAVVGVENEPILCEVAFPPLSSVATEPKRIGYEAAAALDQIMRNLPLSSPPRLVPPSGIITRQSSEILATADQDVADAVRFIRHHPDLRITVGDVAGAVALSRRRLERRFMTALGRTVLAEIHLARIDRAKRMLVDSDLSIPALAARSGFANSQRFNAAFRRLTASTPTEYRRQFRPGI